MNAPGAYDDIDMRGIDPRWYEPFVAADDQRTVIRYDKNLRIIWTPRFDGYRVVSRSYDLAGDPTVTRWADGYLTGWACVYLRTPPADKIDDVEGTLAELRLIDKMKNFASKKAADEATEDGWKLNEKVRLDKLAEATFGPADAALLERAQTPGHILQKQEEARKDAESGRRHVRRGKLIIPAGVAMGRV